MTTNWQVGPPAAVTRAATVDACQSASRLPRVPRRKPVVTDGQRPDRVGRAFGG